MPLWTMITQWALTAVGPIAGAAVAAFAIRANKSVTVRSLQHNEFIERWGRIWDKRFETYQEMLAHMHPMMDAIRQSAEFGMSELRMEGGLIPTQEEWMKAGNEIDARLRLVCSERLWTFRQGYMTYMGRLIESVLALDGRPMSSSDVSEDLRKQAKDAIEKVDLAFRCIVTQVRIDLDSTQESLSIDDQVPIHWEE
jgi:hypothetical protein